jgi:hypothetical protein
MSDPVRHGSGARHADGARPWGVAMVPLLCEACDWRYLAPAGSELAVPGASGAPGTCPHCAAGAVVMLDPEAAHFPYATAPELIVPFTVSLEDIERRVAAFAEDIPYPPEELAPAGARSRTEARPSTLLRQRLQRLYLPMWLVDSDVQARWQAEVGFDYQVVSHQERYADGAGWRSEEVREDRVRWEPRIGRLARHYENVPSPALGQHAQLSRALGSHKVSDGRPYRPELLHGALVRAPDRDPEAAWPEAEVAVRQRAVEECRSAAQAEHIRDFRWSPHYAAQHWTLMLLPVYATYYHDDDGVPQRILLNGETGRLYGVKRGSLARAGRVSLTIGIVALIIFMMSLLMALLSALMPPLLLLGILGALLAVVIGAGAVVPLARVWAFNRRQAKASAEGLK